MKTELDGLLCNQDLQSKIFEPYSNEKKGINNYGLGFRMKEFDNGEKLTYHNGWWHGTNSVFAHLLKSKVTIIAIGNKYSGKVYSALCKKDSKQYAIKLQYFPKTQKYLP